MEYPFVFGYGSLVNRATHGHDDAHPALLKGWRRAWRHTTIRPLAFLTVVPDPDSEIHGLIAGVVRADWATLDLRERAYDRVRAASVTHPLPTAPEVHVYTIPEGKHGAPDRKHPVLLSYIDVVVQGYFREFGEEGVAHFFRTTDGWDAPIAGDRAVPRYSRHQALSGAERRVVDRWLDEVGAVVIAPE